MSYRYTLEPLDILPVSYRYTRHVSRDPYWLVAKYDGICPCGKPVQKGARAFYYPSSRRIHCVECSERHAADFTAHAADEAMYQGA